MGLGVLCLHMEGKGKNISSIILGAIYFGILIWWFSIGSRDLVDTAENFYFGIALGIFPILGGVLGLINAREWGGFQSAIGRTLTCLSLGLITWGVGTLIFGYYNLFLESSVPYPSLADAAYIVSWPLWTLGIISLFKATGAKFQLKKIGGRVLLFVIPLLAIVLSYYLLFVLARGGGFVIDSDGLKAFFDIAYPIGDIVILTVTALLYSLSFGYLGGYFKLPILIILAGFVVNYIADFSFSYTTTKETFFVASWVDMVFATAMFLIGFGVSMFNRGSTKTSQA
jgi:hypothetical protein